MSAAWSHCGPPRSLRRFSVIYAIEVEQFKDVCFDVELVVGAN